MSFTYKFSIWNNQTEHYDFARNFDEAVDLCEIIYGFKGENWEDIKKSSNFNRIKEALDVVGIECEVK